MASIQRRPDGQWRARYRDEHYREHTRHFARRVDAQQWLDSITASVVRGDYVDPKAGAVTLAEHAGRWQASHVSRDNTARIADNARATKPQIAQVAFKHCSEGARPLSWSGR